MPFLQVYSCAPQVICFSCFSLSFYCTFRFDSFCSVNGFVSVCCLMALIYLLENKIFFIFFSPLTVHCKFDSGVARCKCSFVARPRRQADTIMICWRWDLKNLYSAAHKSGSASSPAIREYCETRRCRCCSLVAQAPVPSAQNQAVRAAVITIRHHFVPGMVHHASAPPSSSFNR